MRKLRYIIFKTTYWVYCRSISTLYSIIESLEKGMIGKLVDKIGEPYTTE